MNNFFARNNLWILPLLAMALLAPFTPAWDLSISHYFFDTHHAFSSHAFYIFMFDYGPIPAQSVCGIAIIALALSFFFEGFKNWRQPALVLVLTMAIGAGLLTHAILKDHWGRPRPKLTAEFGGQQPFRPFYQPNVFDQPEPSKSFPCGHCTMGFYFFSLAFVARRHHMNRLFWTSMIWAIFWGTLLSLTRIAQGGHFFSDALAGALVMWLTAYGCDKWVYKASGKEDFT